MLFSEARGHKIVSTATAQTVGQIEDFVVDPASHAVVALTLKKTDSGDTLRWAQITTFGPDAVTVSGADAVTSADSEIAALTGKGHKLVGGLVLTTVGDELGKVADVDFDVESGVVNGLHLADEQIDGIRLVGVGSYAVVVHAQGA